MTGNMHIVFALLCCACGPRAQWPAPPSNQPTGTPPASATPERDDCQRRTLSPQETHVLMACDSLLSPAPVERDHVWRNGHWGYSHEEQRWVWKSGGWISQSEAAKRPQTNTQGSEF